VRAFHLVPDDPGEHELQIDCTSMLEKILLADVCWTAIDHAHSFDRTIGRHGVPIGLLEARKRKLRGIRKGICDYLFWHRASAFALELKVGDNDLDDDQKAFIRRLIAAEVETKVCWSKPQVFDTVVKWGLTRPMQVTA
jgi:hypothetical protein